MDAALPLAIEEELGEPSVHPTSVQQEEEGLPAGEHVQPCLDASHPHACTRCVAR